MALLVDLPLLVAAVATPVAYIISAIAMQMDSPNACTVFRTVMLGAAGYVVYRLWGLFNSKQEDEKQDSSKDSKQEEEKEEGKNDEELEKKLREAEEENKKLKEENDRLKQENNDKQKDDDELLKKELEELRKKNTESQKEIEELRKKDNESQKEIEDLRKKESDAQKEIEELRKRLAENESQEEDTKIEKDSCPSPLIPEDENDMIDASSKAPKRENSIHDIIRKNDDTGKIIQAVNDLEDVNERESGTNQTPLHIVAQTGNVEVTKALLDRGADTRAKDVKENMPIHIASFYGNDGVVELLASKDPSTVNEKNINGNTPLHCFMNGKCADSEKRNGVFNALLNNGADMSMSNNSEDSVLQLAIVNDMFDGLGDFGSSIVESFVEKQCEAPEAMTHVNKRGESLLYTAAFYGKTSLVHTLCEQKSDPSIADKKGWQPLHAAASRGFSDCCEELLTHGADVDAKTLDGTTPAIVASRDGWTEVLRTLVKYSAKLNQANNDGWRPIHAACVKGHLDAVNYLIEQRVDVNCQCTNSHKHTPLMMCILSRSFNADVMKALLGAGADWTVTSSSQYNCLHACTVKDNVEAATILAEYPGLKPKIDYTLRGGSNKTAMDLCVMNNARKVARFISQKTGRRMPLNFSQRRIVASLAVPDAAPAPAEGLPPTPKS